MDDDIFIMEGYDFCEEKIGQQIAAIIMEDSEFCDKVYKLDKDVGNIFNIYDDNGNKLLMGAVDSVEKNKYTIKWPTDIVHKINTICNQGCLLEHREHLYMVALVIMLNEYNKLSLIKGAQ